MGPYSSECLPGALMICFGGELLRRPVVLQILTPPHLGGDLFAAPPAPPPALDLFPFDLWLTCPAVDTLGRM